MLSVLVPGKSARAFNSLNCRWLLLSPCHVANFNQSFDFICVLLRIIAESVVSRLYVDNQGTDQQQRIPSEYLFSNSTCGCEL